MNSKFYFCIGIMSLVLHLELSAAIFVKYGVGTVNQRIQKINCFLVDIDCRMRYNTNYGYK